MKMHRTPTCRSLVPRGLALTAALATVLVTALPAAATSYKGWGDTGWSFYDKRECCDEAVALAQEDAYNACMQTGGRPDRRFNSSRGLCDWDADGGGNDRMYRCTASTSINCR